MRHEVTFVLLNQVAEMLPPVCLECYLLGLFLQFFFVHIPQLGIIYLKLTKVIPSKLWLLFSSGAL